MRKSALAIGVAAAVLALGACGKEEGSAGGNGATATAEGGEAGGKTIAAGIGGNSKFAAAAKAAGLDSTLAGPGPYTVLVPADEAFNKLPNGQYDSWTKPEGRAQLTGVLTYHILPGTVLAEDIGKAIDNAKGKAVLATMGGGTLTATREGGNVVLTDGAGNKATVTRGDQKYSNGVVHQIDGVLMPQQQQQAG
jgi:uncharacterized surface protein with fasciclin (FAS1) repeats